MSQKISPARLGLLSSVIFLIGSIITVIVAVLVINDENTKAKSKAQIIQQIHDLEDELDALH